MDPLLYGWEVNGNRLQPVKMLPNTDLAPPQVMTIVSCGCVSGCETLTCSCHKNTLSCTAFCKCKGKVTCKNPSTVDNRIVDEDSELSADDCIAEDSDECE